MNNDNYVVIHLHSDLSTGVTNIDSVTKYKQYVEKAQSLGMKALAFSEHGSVFEWVHKKESIEAAGMKYIHASEVYLTKDKDPNDKHRDNYHCLLIAKNYDGVKELNKLISTSFNRNDYHFYYAPRITFDELYRTSDNIIISTACLGGVLFKGEVELKKEFLKFMIANKHRCYLEVQHHNCPEQIEYNKLLYVIHQKTNIPLIAGTDTHSLNETHAKVRRILQKGKGVNFENEDAWDMTFKSYDELVKAFEIQNSLPKEVYLNAINNTNVLADSIEPFELDRSKKYPKLYNDSEKAIKEKIVQGIKRRKIDKLPNYKEYQDKIAYELSVYKHNDALDFLLLEEDYKRELRKQGVSYGYSRGSVSGSIIAYLLGITEVDSIRYGLNFERFMNSERVSLADVDTDWSKKDRYKVRDYLFNKQGLYCCDIITFNTIALKGAIKDIGRALGMTVEETQSLCDAVYVDENKKECIDEHYIQQYPLLFEYVETAKGVIVSIGNHPAGLVVSPFPVDEWFGLCSTKNNEHMISQINMKEIDGLQFVKLDVLGLDCVGLINETCDLAGIPRITPDNIEFNDMKVWNEIRDDCTMIFQFESPYAGEYLKQLFNDSTIAKIKAQNPNFSYIDLMSMANGAIRPAGASYRNELSQGEYRDNGHEALNLFLAPTLGYLVYQEQIIAFLNQFCGFTMGQADIVRRGFAKKTGTDKFIPQIKEGFSKTMKEKYGVEEDESEMLITNFIQVIIDASSYLFSLNHAVPYSFLGYAVGYLRCYYKLETVTTALNTYQDDSEKSLEILQYAKKHNIQIKPIKFGKSGAEYTMDKRSNSIYKGIASIKYCNAQIAEELMHLSKNHYNSFFDLLADIKTKTSLDSRQLNILIGLHFFEDFGGNIYLMKLNEIYDLLAETKVLSIDKCEKYGIPQSILTEKNYSKKTAKQYRGLNNLGLMKDWESLLSESMKYKNMDYITQVKFDLEYLEYSEHIEPNVSDSTYFVLNFKTFTNALKPYFTLKQMNSAKEFECRIKDTQLYKHNIFGAYSILKIDNLSKQMQPKKKLIDGEWQESNELEYVLESYEVL